MCGIAGLWKCSEDISSESFKKFLSALAHRGPDGEGIYIDETHRVGLGHRRLAILDLTDNARQPMSYLKRRYWITYNGEIFNFIELKEELKRLGYHFQSESDTEVILAAYDKWGEECQKKFNGMWALAIWDSEKKNLFLSRDRFGIKPLYYVYIPGTFFAFASETLAFKHLDGFKREFDPENLTNVLNNVFCLEGFGKTIFKNIFQVLPGHQILFSHESGIQQKRWWSTLEAGDAIPNLYEDQVKEFRELFTDACRIRMRSDVPLGSALSGGVDSSSVYCMIHDLMRRNAPSIRIPHDWQRAFIATFPGTSLDEAAYANDVIKFTGGQPNYIIPEYSELSESILKLTLQGDYIYLTPPVGNAIYERMMHSGVKVSLDGHGVDEMLGGYPGLVEDAFFTVQSARLNDYANDILNIYLGMLPEATRDEALKHIVSSKKNTIILKYPKMVIRVLPSCLQKKIRQVYTKIVLKNRNAAWLLHPEYLQDPDPDPETMKFMSRFDRSLYTNFHNDILPTILRNFDRSSMGNGIEIRMPFMDWRLVSFVFKLPQTSKIGGGFTKRILRDAMKDKMPENIRTRKSKIGLNAPMIEWFSHELKEFILKEVNSKEFLDSDIWNGPVIRDFVQQKMDAHSWTWDDCTRFWPYLNAHLLMKGEL